MALPPLLAPVDPCNVGEAESTADDDDAANELLTGDREAKVDTTLREDGVARPVTGVDLTVPLRAGVAGDGEVAG